jgi:hypothetical protein
MEVWYRCREKWFLIVSDLPVTESGEKGKYTFSYTLSETVYSDPDAPTQYAEEIRFRFSYTTTDGNFIADKQFPYANDS